jgi:hypothetical protein
LKANKSLLFKKMNQSRGAIAGGSSLRAAGAGIMGSSTGMAGS